MPSISAYKATGHSCDEQQVQHLSSTFKIYIIYISEVIAVHADKNTDLSYPKILAFQQFFPELCLNPSPSSAQVTVEYAMPCDYCLQFFKLIVKVHCLWIRLISIIKFFTYRQYSKLTKPRHIRKKMYHQKLKLQPSQRLEFHQHATAHLLESLQNQRAEEWIQACINTSSTLGKDGKIDISFY